MQFRPGGRWMENAYGVTGSLGSRVHPESHLDNQ